MKTLRVLVLMVVFLTLAACGSDSSNNPGDVDNSTMQATIDGTLWQAEEAGSFTGASGLSLFGRSSDGTKSFDIILRDVSAPGQYPFQSSGQNPGILGGFVDSPATYNFDSGSVTITTFNNSQVIGTFAGHLNQLLGSGDLAVTGGSFSIDR